MSDAIARRDDRVVGRNTHFERMRRGGLQPVPHRFEGEFVDRLAPGFYINGEPIVLEGSVSRNRCDHRPKRGVRFLRRPSEEGRVRVLTRSARFLCNGIPVAVHGDQANTCCDLNPLNGRVVVRDRGFRLTGPRAQAAHRGWLDVQLFDFRGEPLAAQATTIRLADGTHRRLSTDDAGRISLRDLPDGTHHVRFAAVHVEGEPVPGPTDTEAAEETRDVDALIESALSALAQKETRQRAVESRLHTSAGVKASYASQIQSTAPWVLTALRSLADIRTRFGITRADLDSAERRARAVERLYRLARESNKTEAADLLTDPEASGAYRDSGLTDEGDVQRMIDFRELRHEMGRRADTLLTAKTKAQGGQRLPYEQRNMVYEHVGAEFAAKPIGEQLGMDAISLRSYLRCDKDSRCAPIWQEDIAGWQRKVVQSGPKGDAIRQAATADRGLAIGRARVGRIVRQYLAGDPDASDEAVVRHVGRRHQPNDPGYAPAVVEIWRRQGRAAASGEAEPPR